MKLSTKLLLPIAVLGAALVGIVSMSVVLNGHMAASYQRLGLASREMILASEVRALSRAVQRDALKMIQTQDEGELKTLDASTASRSNELLAKAQQLFDLLDGADKANMAEFIALQHQVVARIGQVKAAVRGASAATNYTLFQDTVRPAEKAASKVTDAFIDQKQKQIDTLTVEAEKDHADAAIIQVIGSLIALIVAVAIGLRISIWGVARPAQRLALDVQRIAAGDLAQSDWAGRRRDELGDLARALDELCMQLQAAVALRAEQERLRGQAEQERRSNEQQRAERQAQQQLVVSALADALHHLASGDLTARIDQEFAPDYRALCTDFNAAMMRLQQTMSAIAKATSEVAHGSDEISAASGDFSHRTERQAASLEHTAAAVDEITATVRRSADGARNANEMASAAKLEAQRSGEVMGQAVAAVSEIQESSGKIAQIITVIDEIAFQTNLLALNAGVEAARAGDAGRGFAVVAQEVRALAQRSADAAKEINHLIANSSAQVQRGVRLVSDSGAALEAIVTKVNGVDALIAEIAMSSHEQSIALSQVNAAVNEMDQVTQQNASMVEQAAAAAASLKAEAAELARLVGEFRTEGETRLRDRGAPVRAGQNAPVPVWSRNARQLA